MFYIKCKKEIKSPRDINIVEFHRQNHDLKNGIKAIFKREIKSYFFSSTAFVYITLFLFLLSILTFYIGNLIEKSEATLVPFFTFHIYIYILFIPALAMRLWAEERKTGTIELLLTLPISTRALVIGKFLASWAFIGAALLATFPIWISINILGSPDNLLILFSYLGSFLIAGTFLALCGFVSVHTDNQVIAFIGGSVLCFMFLIAGFPVILDPLSQFLPPYFISLVTNFSLLTHYENFIKGYFELSAIIYICSVTMLWVFLTELRIHALRLWGQ